MKAEKLLYTAYIALIFTLYPEKEQNFETLIELINASECREDDEEFKNTVDVQFEMLEHWLNNDFTQDYDPDVDFGDDESVEFYCTISFHYKNVYVLNILIF